jgi:hypothetical protein
VRHNGLALIAARYDVVDRARVLDPQRPSHAGTLPAEIAAGNRIDNLRSDPRAPAEAFQAESRDVAPRRQGDAE